MARLEQRGLLFRGIEQKEEGGEQLWNLLNHFVHEVLIAGDIGKLRLFVEQAGADHDRQQQLADLILGILEPDVLAQEHAFHEADAPAAQVGVVRIVAQVEFAGQFGIVVAGQLTGDVRLELNQGAFDLFALGVAAVMRRFGEQGVDPLALGHLFRADRQGGQVAVGSHVVECLVMQIVGIEKGLQAGQLLGEGHGAATL